MKPLASFFQKDLRGEWRAVTVRATLVAIIAVSLQQTGRCANTNYIVLQPHAGGLSASPDISSATLSNLQAILNWNGFAGPYQVEGRPAFGTGGWQPVGGSTSNKSITLPNVGTNQFFRINGKPPPYTGSDTCVDCHGTTHANWSQTLHATAFDTLKAIGQDKNPSCVVCHTVGFGYSSGFIDEATTPSFANVQCENCHGPATAHALDENNLALRPIKTPSAMMCGGCHTTEMHPTYDEWLKAGHSEVVPDVAANILGTNGVAQMKSCGTCHSGAVRLAMLDWVAKGTLTLPSAQEAVEVPITCVVCHDPHKPNLDDTHSLRYPRTSTNFFSYSTSASNTFTNQYNPNIQGCAQCHNMRGAQPTDTSRPPHHSPQYNILIGDAGAALGYIPATLTEQSYHRNIDTQCSHCHTHQEPVANPTPSNPSSTGHTFAPDLRSCLDCHNPTNTISAPYPVEVAMTNTQAATKLAIQEVKGLLDAWATNKAPAALVSKYGTLAWEYNVVGQLSNPTANPAIVGPTTAEQNTPTNAPPVPLVIKKARMYLYLVEHDGSFGVHNAKYAEYLLNSAKTNVLNAP